MGGRGHEKEENIRLGRELYDGEFVDIDVDSGVWELGDDGLSASRSVFARKPEAAVCLPKVGHPTAYRIGARRTARTTR